MRLPSKNLRPVLTLVVIGLVSALTLAGLDQLTGERIAREQQTRALSAVSGMLADRDFDNNLLEDWIELPIEGFEQPATAYRARLAGEPVAMVIDVTTPRGYSGDIRLLVAVDVDGTVRQVGVLEHRETPGLGDRVEARRSDWLEQFPGRSLRDPEPDGWAPDRRGGDFDTLTSATITVAAIVEAVKRTLQVIEAQPENIFSQQAEHP